MIGGEDGLRLLRYEARVAAACGAATVPGEALLATLEAVSDRFRAPLALCSDARLDRLGVVLRVRADAVSDVFAALGHDPDPARALLAELAPAEVTVRVTSTRDGQTAARVEVPVDVALGDALDLLRSVGTSEAARIAAREIAGDLRLVRVADLWVEDGAAGLRLAHAVTPEALPKRQEALAAACARVGASNAQIGLHQALLEVLGVPRGSAPVTLVLGEDGVEALSVTYAAVAATTVLRIIEQTHPQDRSGAVLGALVAAAEAEDRADVEVFAHPGEPPEARFVLASG